MVFLNSMTFHEQGHPGHGVNMSTPPLPDGAPATDAEPYLDSLTRAPGPRWELRPQTPLEARPVVQPDIFRPGDAPASDPCTWQRDLEYHFTARQSTASTTEPRLQILSSFRTTKFPQNAVNVKHLGNERGGREGGREGARNQKTVSNDASGCDMTRDVAFATMSGTSGRNETRANDDDDDDESPTLRTKPIQLFSVHQAPATAVSYDSR